MAADVKNLFDLTGRVAIITGGAGLLGTRHASAIAEAGGHPVLADLSGDAAAAAAARVQEATGVAAMGIRVDVTSPPDVQAMVRQVLEHFGRIDVLINNAAMTVKGGSARA